MQEDLIDAIAALRPRVLSIVSKGVWHCTHHDRYADILLSGAILPEPSIDDADRWKTGAGPKHYPFARHQGGVSLFQFEPFEPDTYERDYPLSDWRTFVPCIKAWSATIWIEVDTSHLADFIPGPQLIQRWRGVDRLGYAITPRFAPSCSEAQLRGAGELAARYPSVWIQSHVAENLDEVQEIALWRLLDSDVRRELKKEGNARREAAKKSKEPT